MADLKVPEFFKVPSWKALDVMDCFLQNSKVSQRWEKSNIYDYYRDDEGIGWEGVFKNNQGCFYSAWALAYQFMTNYDLWEEEDLKDWY